MPTPPTSSLGLRAALRRAALVLGGFCLLTGAVLIVRNLAVQGEKPLDSPHLIALKEAFAKNTADEALKERIRVVDAEVRNEFFSRVRFSQHGGELLLLGTVLLVAAWQLAGEGGTKVLDPRKSKPPNPFLENAAGRWVVGAVGAALAAVLMLLVIQPWGREASDLGLRVDDLGLNGASAPANPQLAPPKPQPVVPSPQPAVASPQPPGPTPREEPKEQPKKDEAPAGGVGAAGGDGWAANWPAFRGPFGNPLVGEGLWPTKWDVLKGEGIVWKVKVPLGGESSPVIWKDRLFLTGCDATTRAVMCFARADGKLLWQTTVGKGPYEGEDNGATAVTDGQRVYAVFASGEFAALDFDGKIVWKQEWGALKNQYNYCASLAYGNGKLFVQLDTEEPDEPGQRPNPGLYAYDAATGNRVWHARRDEATWSSPVFVSTESGAQVICCGSDVTAYDPETGKPIWTATGLLAGDIAPSPAYVKGRVYVCMENSGLFAIATDGKDNVTKTHVKWKYEESAAPDTSSPVSDGTFVYAFSSKGVALCVQAEDGRKVWEEETNGEFYPTPVLAGKTLYCLSNDGKMFLYAAGGEEFKQLGQCALGEGAVSTPAFLNGRIYIRGNKNLFCIGKK
jgi:outer membrane protein assembly factor BamB